MRSAESRAGHRHPPCQRCATPGRPARELADAGTGRRLLGHSTPSTPRALRDHAMVAMLIDVDCAGLSCSR